MAISRIIGTSWPWKTFPEFIENTDAMDAAVQDVIMTALRERKMNTSYGSDAQKIVFENKGILLRSLAQREISIALAEHLPSIEVLNIDVEEGERDTEPVTIIITFRHRGVISTVNTTLPAV